MIREKIDGATGEAPAAADDIDNMDAGAAQMSGLSALGDGLSLGGGNIVLGGGDLSLSGLGDLGEIFDGLFNLGERTRVPQGVIAQVDAADEKTELSPYLDGKLSQAISNTTNTSNRQVNVTLNIAPGSNVDRAMLDRAMADLIAKLTPILGGED